MKSSRKQTEASPGSRSRAPPQEAISMRFAYGKGATNKISPNDMEAAAAAARLFSHRSRCERGRGLLAPRQKPTLVCRVTARRASFELLISVPASLVTRCLSLPGLPG